MKGLSGEGQGSLHTVHGRQRGVCSNTDPSHTQALALPVLWRQGADSNQDILCSFVKEKFSIISCVGLVQ